MPARTAVGAHAALLFTAVNRFFTGSRGLGMVPSSCVRTVVRPETCHQR